MNEENRSNDVSLLDFFYDLQRYKLLLIGLPLLGAGLSILLVSYVLHPVWEASAILEVGKVGQGQKIVEPLPNVMTRMMLPSFSKAAINYAGIKPEEIKTMQRFYGTLKVAQVKGAELIEIKLRGPSAEMAKSLLYGAIVNLQTIHTEMMATTIDKNKKQLQILTENIQKTTADNGWLRGKLLASHNWNAFDATLSANLLKDKTLDLRDMVQQKLLLEEQLSPSQTYTTRVIGNAAVSEDPVSPNKLSILGLSILLGLFGAVFFAFAHKAITKRHERS